MSVKFALSTLAFAAVSATAAHARGEIRGVGWLAVFPDGQAVAGQGVNIACAPSPIADSIGTGDACVELAMHSGCTQQEYVTAGVYLSKRGMVPLVDDIRKATREAVIAGKTIDAK